MRSCLRCATTNIALLCSVWHICTRLYSQENCILPPGDGTTSTVLLIGELLKQADIYVAEGLHPRLLTEGFDKAKNKALEVLDQIKIPIEINKENLLNVCRTSLRTKVN